MSYQVAEDVEGETRDEFLALVLFTLLAFIEIFQIMMVNVLLLEWIVIAGVYLHMQKKCALAIFSFLYYGFCLFAICKLFDCDM